MSDSQTSVTRFLSGLEKRMETGFSEVHANFSAVQKTFEKLWDRLDRSDRETDHRFAEMQAQAAKSGLISPGALLTGAVAIIGLVLSNIVAASALVLYVTRSETGQRAAEERYAALERQASQLVQTERRLTALESR